MYLLLCLPQQLLFFEGIVIFCVLVVGYVYYVWRVRLHSCAFSFF